MTGITAEKHDSFISPAPDGGVIMEFTGRELIQGRAGRLLLPLRRPARHLRGPRLHRLGPHQLRLHQRAALSASPRPSAPTAARPSTKRPRCCARWTRSSRAGPARPAPASATGTRGGSSPPSGLSRNISWWTRELYQKAPRPRLYRAAPSSARARPRARSSTTTTSAASSPGCAAYMQDLDEELLEARRPRQDRAQRGGPRPARARAHLRHRPTIATRPQPARQWSSCRRSPPATAWSACCTKSPSPASTAPASTTTGPSRRTGA